MLVTSIGEAPVDAGHSESVNIVDSGHSNGGVHVGVLFYTEQNPKYL